MHKYVCTHTYNPYTYIYIYIKSKLGTPIVKLTYVIQKIWLQYLPFTIQWRIMCVRCQIPLWSRHSTRVCRNLEVTNITRRKMTIDVIRVGHIFFFLMLLSETCCVVIYMASEIQYRCHLSRHGMAIFIAKIRQWWDCLISARESPCRFKCIFISKRALYCQKLFGTALLPSLFDTNN